MTDATVLEPAKQQFDAGRMPRTNLDVKRRGVPIVVITGAGAGVGRATVAEFARNGCDVALLSRDPERLEAAAAEARTFGVRALPIATDVADAAAVEAAARRGLNKNWAQSTYGSMWRWRRCSPRSPSWNQRK